MMHSKQFLASKYEARLVSSNIQGAAMSN